MPDASWTPRALLGALWACAALFLIAYAGAVDADARRANGGDGSPHQALTAPLASLADNAGVSAQLERWAATRDRWYAGGPEWGRVRVAPPPPAPAPEERAPPPPPPPLAEGTERVAVLHPQGPDAYAPAPFRPTRVLIVGASSIQFELGRALESQLEERPGLVVERWGRHSTGLSRADYFDWIAKGVELADAFRPDLVIAQVGGNDCQVITRADGSEVARFPNEDEWNAAYAERVREFVGVFTERGARVVVLGMPIMRSRSFRAKMERLNGVAHDAVASTHERFVSTWAWTADERGEYRGTATIDGRERVIRADDGIHMTVHGANDVATRTLESLSRAIAFPDPAP